MSADLLAKLIEAGTPAALIAEVAMALGRAEAAVEAIETRRAKDRARKAVPRNSTESAECAETLCPLTPPLKKPPHPYKIPPPISPNPTIEMRARRLPDDWKPLPLTGKAAAMVDRWQAGEVEREIAKFRNYWMGKAGKDACKTDWQRTFINWLISADERKPRNAHSANPQSDTRPRSRLLDALNAADEAIARSPLYEDHAGAWTALPSAGTG